MMIIYPKLVKCIPSIHIRCYGDFLGEPGAIAGQNKTQSKIGQLDEPGKNNKLQAID